MGKGDKPRPVDKKKWDEAPYWVELEKRKQKEKDANISREGKKGA